MSEGSFTLRTLGERAESAFQSIEATAQSTAATLQNDAVVDWPLWIFGVGARGALLYRPYLGNRARGFGGHLGRIVWVSASRGSQTQTGINQ